MSTETTREMFCAECEQVAPLQRGRRRVFASHRRADGAECSASRCAVGGIAEGCARKAILRYGRNPDLVNLALLKHAAAIYARCDREWWHRGASDGE